MQRSEYQIGKLLRSIREEQKIPLEKVCYGLCGEETLMRMEEGKREPGKLLLDALFQRLGTSADQYETIYYGEEYEVCRRMHEIVCALRDEEWETAGEKLKEFPRQRRNTTNLTLQFRRWAGILLKERKGEFSQKKVLAHKKAILQILKLTIPEFDLEKIS